MKSFIELGVKIPRNDVLGFLIKSGVDANQAMILAHSEKDGPIKERNTLLRKHILKMIYNKVD